MFHLPQKLIYYCAVIILLYLLCLEKGRDRSLLGRQWECMRDVLGSGVILALLSIKPHKPAGRTKNPVLSPRGCYFQKCLAKSLLPVFLPTSNPVLCTFPKPVNTTKSHHSPVRRDVSICESPGWCWPGTVWPQAGFSHRERGGRAGRWLCLPPGNCPWLQHVLAGGRGWENKQILHVMQWSPCKGFVTQSKAGPSSS